MNPRHSKIVCTIGPATRSPRMIRKLLLAGMDVARLNFSHGTHAEHAQSFAMLREAAAAFEKPIAILADLQGPKIRTGALAGGGTVTLRAGQKFVITTAKILGDSTRVSTIFHPLPREVKAGDRILLSDGLIELRVERIRKQEVICQVVNGGLLGEHKGINLPGVKLRVPALTDKDRKDLRFALAHGADYIAVSFVRRPEDVLLAKSLIRRAKKRHAGDRQAGKARSHRKPGSDSARFRGRDGGARRSGRGDEPRARSRGAEEHHRASARIPPSGDHRHADAGIHDRKSAADPRGGFRRGQCHFRWLGRRDALRRNGHAESIRWKPYR